MPLLCLPRNVTVHQPAWYRKPAYLYLGFPVRMCSLKPCFTGTLPWTISFLLCAAQLLGQGCSQRMTKFSTLLTPTLCWALCHPQLSSSALCYHRKQDQRATECHCSFPVPLLHWQMSGLVTAWTYLQQGFCTDRGLSHCSFKAKCEKDNAVDCQRRWQEGVCIGMCFPDLLRGWETALFRFALPKSLPRPMVGEHVSSKNIVGGSL